jgi:uncharacterized OB-fold protein
MIDHSGKSFPRPTPETAEFWQRCSEYILSVQCCDDCGHYQFYPRIFCTQCNGRQLSWSTVTGRGTVRSFTICRRAVSKAYAAEGDYVVALIELEEGPTMMSNVVQCELESVSVGMPVEVCFEQWSEEITIPKFRPVQS